MKTYLSVPSLHATASHIGVLNAKLAKLAQAKDDCWAQLLSATARLYATGDLSMVDRATLLAEMKASYGSGYTNVWDVTMPMVASRVQWLAKREQRLALIPQAATWLGDLPLNDSVVPPAGIAVVYVLFDSRNEPIYVGSTETLAVRLAAHHRTKPEAVRWTAQRCRDREHAYEVEDRVLKENKPRMNKRAAR